MNFLERFLLPDGLLSVAIGNINTPQYYAEVPDIPCDDTVYFGPAARKIKSDKKEDILGTNYLWVDVDNTQRPNPTLPPSIQVWSGHGWHLYWRLSVPLLDTDEIESCNKILANDIPTADRACWNVNRFLRAPGSVNKKEPTAIEKVEVRDERQVEYSRADFSVLALLDNPTRHRISTGDRRGYKSRSERDWAIIRALITAGATDSLIETIFHYQKCGDKYNDATTNEEYLAHSIAKARDEAPRGEPGSFEEREDGYYIGGRRGSRRVSTFTIDPQFLLDGSNFGADDAIVGDVHAGGHVWKGITFTRSAFTSNNKLDRECPVAAWQWTGRDDEVRTLLPFLLDKLREKGLPRVAATPTVGLHQMKGEWYFVGDMQVLSKDNVWNGCDGPIGWLPSKAEHPHLDLSGEMDPTLPAFLRTTIPLLNDEEVIWPILGWYAASALKPWLETKNYRFPILNVSGTRGSGKTTLIQRVCMPLFGQLDPKSYDAGTTRFVMLSCLGSSNAVPIAFSEFRYESVEKFLRYILLAYDTGHDPRGRADQTTVDYALTAPFSVDGEDLIADPAARERIVVAALHPNSIAEGSVAHENFKKFRGRDLRGFGKLYVQNLLGQLSAGSLDVALQQASEAVFRAYPARLPDRVRNNHIVAYFGVLLLADFLGLQRPEPHCLGRSLESVYNITAGRGRTLADDFTEDISNAVPTGYFKNSTSEVDGVVFFQMATAYAWWVQSRRRQGRGALAKDAIVTQLREAPYVVGPQTVDGLWMFGIDLAKAIDAGLDVPQSIDALTFKFTTL